MAGIDNYSNLMHGNKRTFYVNDEEELEEYSTHSDRSKNPMKSGFSAESLSSNPMHGDKRTFYVNDEEELEEYSTHSGRHKNPIKSGFSVESLPSGSAKKAPNDIASGRPLHYTLNNVEHSYYDMVNDGSSKYTGSNRNLSLPLEKQKGLENYYDSENDGEFPEPERSFSEASMRQYLGVSLQWVSLVTENLLSHPFIVLRRQCQVYNASNYYHLHPLYLIPSIIHLHRRQGVTTLWKGVGSCLLVRGLSMSIEDILSKVTNWPKEVDSRTNFRRFRQHVLLKSISIAIVMPYYAASLVESVQSDIASEKPGILDVFREGSLRWLYWKYPQKGRMLPVWALIGPCISVGITKYLFGLVIRGITTRLMRQRWFKKKAGKGAKLKDNSIENQNSEAYANLISIVTTEVIFYPFETILHRIQLQGTRTIIDNLDNGYAVVPILTNYQSAIDCYKTTIATEGFSGLYKGFGALVLQFAAHIAVIKLTKWVIIQINEILSTRPPAKVMQYYNLDRAIAASSSTLISPNISSRGSDLNIPTATPPTAEK